MTLQSLQQLWCCYMLVARSKWCMKWGNLRGVSLERLEKAVHGTVLFSFPAACLILINFSCQNENSFHSEQKMALFEKKNPKTWKQGSIRVPLFFSRCSNTFRCSEHLRVAWWPQGWPELAGLWHIQMLIGCHCGCQMFHGYILMNNYQLDFMKN